VRIVVVFQKNAETRNRQKIVLIVLGMNVVAGQPFIKSNQKVNRFVEVVSF